MARKRPKREYRLYSSAAYRICVQGRIDEYYAERLGGLTIAEITDDAVPVTTLCGLLADQAALIGVFNTLYNIMHVPLLLVELIEAEEVQECC